MGSYACAKCFSLNLGLEAQSLLRLEGFADTLRGHVTGKGALRVHRISAG